jgi:hypothetical protein
MKQLTDERVMTLIYLVRVFRRTRHLIPKFRTYTHQLASLNNLRYLARVVVTATISCAMYKHPPFHLPCAQFHFHTDSMRCNQCNRYLQRKQAISQESWPVKHRNLSAVRPPAATYLCGLYYSAQILRYIKWVHGYNHLNVSSAESRREPAFTDLHVG